MDIYSDNDLIEALSNKLQIKAIREPGIAVSINDSVNEVFTACSTFKQYEIFVKKTILSTSILISRIIKPTRYVENNFWERLFSGVRVREIPGDYLPLVTFNVGDITRERRIVHDLEGLRLFVQEVKIAVTKIEIEEEKLRTLEAKKQKELMQHEEATNEIVYGKKG